MVALNNGGEGGTDGAAVTSGNSGGVSGNAWDSVTGAPTFDSAHAYGSLAYKFDLAASSTSRQLIWSSALGTQSEVWGRFYLWTGAAPPVTNRVGIVRGLVGGGQAFRITWETDGTIAFRDAGNGITGGGTMVTSAALPSNQWVRVEFHAIPLSSTGTAELRVYHNADSTTATQTLSTTSSNMVAGVDSLQWGAFVGATCTATFWLDLINANTTGFPGLGAVFVSPTGIGSAAGVGTPAVAAGAVAVAPTGVASAEALGTPIVDLGSRTVVPAGIASAEALGTPGVGAGPVTVSPDGIPSGEVFGTPGLFRAWFYPPTVAEGPVAPGPLFSRYKLRRGITVVKWGDGSYSSLRYPAQTDLEIAVRVYLGGHVYELNASEADELTAAGYGDYIEYG